MPHGLPRELLKGLTFNVLVYYCVQHSLEIESIQICFLDIIIGIIASSAQCGSRMTFLKLLLPVIFRLKCLIYLFC